MTTRYLLTCDVINPLIFTLFTIHLAVHQHARCQSVREGLPLTYLCYLQHDGRLKLHKGGVIFKANKTGKVDQAAVADIESTQWMRVARGFELNVALTNGSQFKFEGFKEGVSQILLCYDSADFTSMITSTLKSIHTTGSYAKPNNVA